MKSFKNWWYKDKIETVRKKVIEVYNDNKNNFEKYDSREEFENEMDKIVKKDNSEEMKNETVKSHYELIKKPLINQYNNNLINNKLEKLQKLLMNSSREVVYEYRESEESRRLRMQNAIEENNRKKASEELPKFLDEVKNEFSTKLKENISEKKEEIEKELSNYSPLDLKIFLQNLAEKEKLKDILIIDSKNEIEKIFLISYDNSYNFNIILIGKTGVGKSTLINGVFGFPNNEGAKTGDGKPITQEYEEFMSDTRKGLRLIDSKGIEMGNYGIDASFNSTKELIEKRARDRDPDKFIHCIWYCFKSSNSRFEDIEKETLTRLMNQYEDNQLPIIIVITQNYDDNKTEIMTKMLQEEFKTLNREIHILPVIAQDYIQEKKKNKIIIEKEGIDELLKISFEMSKKAIYPAFLKSIEEKTSQAFDIKTEEKKNTLKEKLKENVQIILNNITENDEITQSISKLSTIFENTLNIFFEITNISQESKNNITLFLEDLCKWCIEKLNTVVMDLVKENSDELSRLLLRKQTDVKINNNVKKQLDNEKTLEEFENQCEEYLKPSIINQVYYLAIKKIYNIISENLIEISEVVMKEQFDEIKPEIKNEISEEKLKKISDKILREIIKNE